MDKEEPIFNIWGEISVSELVLEAAKVEQKYEKQQEKRRFAQLEEDDLQQRAKNKWNCKNKSTTIFRGRQWSSDSYQCLNKEILVN